MTEKEREDYCKCDYFGSPLFKPNLEYTKCLTCGKVINQAQTYRGKPFKPQEVSLEEIGKFIFDWADKQANSDVYMEDNDTKLATALLTKYEIKRK